MSYNTRRQGGVGRGASQVMYHQQQQSQVQRSSVPSRPSGPTQSTQGYPSIYNSQPSGGNYSPGGNQGYSQQYQAQQQPQQSPMAQQVVPPPPPPPVSIQQPPAQKPLQGILKTESSLLPPIKKPMSPTRDAEENAEAAHDDAEDNDARSKPPWIKKKPFGFKVNKVVKRRRQNARLRKLLQPKNGIMVLNELVTGVKFTVQENISPLARLMFQVSTEIDGKVYTGQALSKTVAKQTCAENALKAIILEKISKSPMKLDTSSTEKKEDSNNTVGGLSDGDGDGEGEEETSNSDKNMEVMEDDVPWKSLTSFAIYKLFLEWQNEGAPVPGYVGMPKPSGSSGPQPEVENSPKPMKKVPANPTERHPVMLLNHMRPGVEFVELSRTGNPPDITFTMQTTVDNKTYSGTGKNKKEAKKEAAKAALAGALDIHYP